MDRLLAGLMTLVLAVVVGCSSPKGEKGDPGASGSDGPAGAQGPSGAQGPVGPGGAQGDPGAPGAAGPGGAQGPVGPGGAQGDAGAPGSSTGDVTVWVFDTLTLAAVQGAQVLAAPGGELVTTGVNGAAVFTGLPVGVHTFSVEGASLALRGNDVVPAYLVSAPPVPLSVRAGTQSSVAVSLPRLWAENFNLVALHTSANPLFKNTNCAACHGSRAAELARDGTTPSYHKRHSALGCVMCHATTDLTEESGAHLRKQVSPASCLGCHTQYPNRICAVPTCP